MHFGVLSSEESWYFGDLARAAGAEYRLTCLSFNQLWSDGNHSGNEHLFAGDHALSQFDALLVRTMPPGSLEQVVFRMNLLARFEQAGGVVLNSPRALEVAVDKYLTTAKLVSAGLRSPRTIVCQTVDQALQAFSTLGGDVVLKPLFGGEGRGITRLRDEALIWRTLKLFERLGTVVYLQEFIPHQGFDCRLFVLGERLYAMKRSNPHDWRTNVSRGATTERFEPAPELADIAFRAAQAVGANIVGVDLLPATDGSWYGLEVNAVPGWKALAPTVQVDIAREILDFTCGQVRERRGTRT